MASERWNVETHTPHGGQEWRDNPNFVEDFSVTTNPLKTPKRALQAAASALGSVSHYPSCDQEPACTKLACFLHSIKKCCQADGIVNGGLQSHEETIQNIRERLVLGNGASELIDMCIRISGASTWSPGPSDVQYKEYERSAVNMGLKLARNKHAELVCIVNPCNPTGDFLSIELLKQYIEKQMDGATVLVDESMLPWQGPEWRSQSLVSQGRWVNDIYNTRQLQVFTIHSWTKLWACPGLRIGSVLAPTVKEAVRLRQHQVPWSVNTLASTFLSEVVNDTEYLEETWKLTPAWGSIFRDALKRIHPQWKLYGQSWLPFIWIDTKDVTAAQFYVHLCNQKGVPIRWGAHGYERPSYIRVAVRHPDVTSIVLDVFRTPCPVSQ